MKKLVSWAVALLITISTSFALVGCYTPDEGYTPVNPGTLPEKIAGKDYETLAAQKYDPAIKITVAGVDYPLEEGVKPGTSLKNQAFTALAKDYLGIELEFKITGSSTNYDQKLNLAIGAGNIPDMFYTTDATLFSSMVRNNQLADLGDIFYYLNQDLQDIYLDYMPELLPNCMVEGELFAFPMAGNKYESAQKLYIRKDWLEKLGLSAPKTVAEMISVGEAFYQNASILGWPQNQIVPLGMHKDINWLGTQSAAGLFNCFGASATAYFDDGNDNLITGAISNEMKTAITVMREMYQKKVIDQQFVSKNVDAVGADISAGKVGMVFGEWFLPEYKLNDTINNVSGADWIAVELPVYGTATEAQPIVKRVNLTGYNVVSKSCQYPEAAAKLINLFYNIYYNDDAETIYDERVRPENGFFHNYVPIKLWNSLSSIVEYKRVQKAFDDAYAAGARAEFKVLTNGEYNSLEPSHKAEYDAQLAAYNTLRSREKRLHWEKGYPYFCALKEGKTVGQMTDTEKIGWGIYHEMIAPDGGYAYVAELTEGTKTAKYDEFFGSPTSQMIIYGEQLNTKAAIAYTAIITGSKPLSYWDTFVSEYNKEGGESITKQINAWYDAQWKA